MKVKELVRRAICEYNMLSDGDSVLVGFSGGSDSVCLLSVLYDMGYKVTAAHLNHNMRETAGRDLLFCEDFCKRRNIPFVSKTVETGVLKSEADAREARYRFFYDVMREKGIYRLATAHNKNDSAETVLLHMLRGASTDGLSGISPLDSSLIRPLLFVKKSEVIEYCNNNGLDFVTDETNLSDKYTRNKLRNRFIPELKSEFNPQLIDTLADNALLTLYDRDYLANSASDAFEKIKINGGVSVAELCKLHRAISSRILQLMWRQKSDNGQNLSRKFIEDILKLASYNKSGSSIDLPCAFTARIEYDILRIEKKTENISFNNEITIGTWYDFEEIGAKIGLFESGDGLRISLDGTERLVVRTREKGDRFSPSGLGGSKTLSDYFTDIKLPRKERDAIPILIADGNIAAVGTLRADKAFAKGVRNKDYVFRIVKI